jgi:hypothetical protein
MALERLILRLMDSFELMHDLFIHLLIVEDADLVMRCFG